MTTLLSTPSVSAGVGTMRAAVITAPQHVDLVDVAIPTPAPNQVLIKLEGCGVCSSNIPPWEGRDWFHYPFTPGQLGHEGWGRVAAIGDQVRDIPLGQRVGFISEHSYAEYDLADPAAIVPIPPELDGQPIPPEPLGCAMNIFKRSGIRAGDTVAIVGIGFLGILLTQLASKAGAKVIAINRRASTLTLARQKGAAYTILMDDHYRIIDEVKKITKDRFCDVVIEAVGKEWPLNLAAELTRERGRLIIAGYHQDGLRSVNVQLWNWRGLDVINAHERDPKVYKTGMIETLQAIRTRMLDLTGLFTHTFTLDHLADALAMTRDRPEGFMKALIVFEG